jgi:hypothetical protein
MYKALSEQERVQKRQEDKMAKIHAEREKRSTQTINPPMRNREAAHQHMIKEKMSDMVSPEDNDILHERFREGLSEQSVEVSEQSTQTASATDLRASKEQAEAARLKVAGDAADDKELEESDTSKDNMTDVKIGNLLQGKRAISFEDQQKQDNAADDEARGAAASNSSSSKAKAKDKTKSISTQRGKEGRDEGKEQASRRNKNMEGIVHGTPQDARGHKSPFKMSRGASEQEHNKQEQRRESRSRSPTRSASLGSTSESDLIQEYEADASHDPKLTKYLKAKLSQHRKRNQEELERKEDRVLDRLGDIERVAETARRQAVHVLFSKAQEQSKDASRRFTIYGWNWKTPVDERQKNLQCILSECKLDDKDIKMVTWENTWGKLSQTSFMNARQQPQDKPPLTGMDAPSGDARISWLTTSMPGACQLTS